MMRLFLTLILTSSVAFGAPASGDPASEITVHQISEFIAVGVMIISFSLGAILGHAR